MDSKLPHEQACPWRHGLKWSLRIYDLIVSQARSKNELKERLQGMSSTCKARGHSTGQYRVQAQHCAKRNARVSILVVASGGSLV
jgi:hypothetical protein